MKWPSTEVRDSMVAPFYRLHCLLKRAQMLLLCLGIAYLMAGSILLLQRSSVRVAQSNLVSLPPLLSLAAPPTILRSAGLGVRARSRWAAVQSVSGGGVKAGRRWPASQSLGSNTCIAAGFTVCCQRVQSRRSLSTGAADIKVNNDTDLAAVSVNILKIFYLRSV